MKCHEWIEPNGTCKVMDMRLNIWTPSRNSISMWEFDKSIDQTNETS